MCSYCNHKCNRLTPAALGEVRMLKRPAAELFNELTMNTFRRATPLAQNIGTD